MYDFQRDTQSATHLYRLVKVIKFYTDMGPCDQQTQQAAHTLSEERLLKEHVTYQAIYVNVVNQCQILSPPSQTSVQICPLLDCDTVQQAKEKIVSFIFKGAIRPAVRDVELELCLLVLQNEEQLQQQQQQTTVITLRDTEDELIATTQPHMESSGCTRLLTLKDYNIQNGSFINLAYKSSLQSSQQQQLLNQNHVYQSMNNEYSLYGTGQANANVNATGTRYI